MVAVKVFKHFLNVYFIFERERERKRVSKSKSERGRGRERDGETQNPKQAPGSELSAQNPMRSSNSWTVRS